MAGISRFGTGWRVRFYDGNGKRQQISVAGVTKRQAETIARHCGVLNASRIANDGDIDRQTALWLKGIGQALHDKLAAAGLVEARSNTALGPFLRQYMKSRTDVTDATQKKFQSAVNHLLAFFGEHRGLRSITEAEADAFRVYMVRAGLADNSVRRYIGLCKQFFRAALRAKLVDSDPFCDQVAAVRGNPAKFHYVNREDAAKILAACPDMQWKMIFALCRFGGLRCPSEVLALQWEDINWQNGRFAVHSSKTEHHGKGLRFVPLYPELAAVLSEGFEYALAAADSTAEATKPQTVTGPVITRYRDATQNLRTTFRKIVIRAGLQPWPKLLQNLRSTRETELAAEDGYPLHLVCAWQGNSEAVAAKHYLQVRDEDYRRAAAGSGLAPPLAPQACERGETRPQRTQQTREKRSVLRGFAESFAGLQGAGLGPTGLEPGQENTGFRADSETISPTISPVADIEAALRVLAAVNQTQLQTLLELSSTAIESSGDRMQHQQVR